MAPPKAKTQKMSLGDFLGDQSLGSWADEMEDMPVPSSDSRTGYGGERRAFSSGYGMERGFSDRGDRGFASREQLPLPTKPPFTAHLGNLSFDATEGDIQDFFADCSVTNVRIVEDKLEHKPKGFGYVEFGTLDGLKKALELSGTQFQGRNIRVSVADPPKDRQDREPLDWTRKGPLPDLPNARRGMDRGSSFRNYETASDAGSERGERRRPEGDGKSRDFSNWERKGPLSPVTPTGSFRDAPRPRAEGAPARERKQSPSWGEGRNQEGGRPPRKEYQERPERPERPQQDRQPTASELDNQWRARMRPDAPLKSPVATPDTSSPSSPAAAQAPAPAQRPRLNLQKRTVSEIDPAAQSASAGDAKASPFGAARPIDTAAREREVAEKREVAIRTKKEQDEKAREEKKQREAAAKAEKEKESTEGTDNGSKDEDSAKKTEEGAGAPGKNYEILRRTTDDGDAEKAVDQPANGNAARETPKPQEMTRQPSKGFEGSWRKKPEAPQPSSSGPTADNLEEDGWSTVPQKSKNNRRGGNAGARAIAS